MFIFPVCKWRFWTDGAIKENVRVMSINPLAIHYKYQGDIFMIRCHGEKCKCNLIL